MKATLLALSLTLAASAATAPAASPPLCRVAATVRGVPFPPLRSITLRLHSGCPPFGHAFVRLRSTSGATDPVYGWDELTPGDPSLIFRGVLPYWLPEWQAESGKTYRIPEGR